MPRFFAVLLLTALLQACGGGGGGGDPAPPAKPVVPAPVLWSAPVGATPASGNYVYLQSDSGDVIGEGRTSVYTHDDAAMTVSNNGLTIVALMAGKEQWEGYLQVPNPPGKLQAGYFKDLTGTVFKGTAAGGVQWTGNGRSCSALKGWIVIDKVVLNGDKLESLDLRFEQSCAGGAPLHGQIHWNMADVPKDQEPGTTSVPPDLWRAAPSAVPPSGNYVHLESAADDIIGAGRTYDYTLTNALIKLNQLSSYIGVQVVGNESWHGDFVGASGVTELKEGYYGHVSNFPFHNRVLGGLNWSAPGRRCGVLRGWFVVDKATYVAGNLKVLDLRFEQRCDGAGVLHGQVHWRADDTSVPAGPQNPPPADLWKPDANFVAPLGNYVYLVSDANDAVGAGRTQLLTPGSSKIELRANQMGELNVQAGPWTGDFAAMRDYPELKPGYYGDLQRYPGYNPAKGGLQWSGERACSALKGWFVVDKVSYEGYQLKAIDLRFEQRCNDGVAAQRGVIHWAR